MNNGAGIEITNNETIELENPYFGMQAGMGIIKHRGSEGYTRTG